MGVYGTDLRRGPSSQQDVSDLSERDRISYTKPFLAPWMEERVQGQVGSPGVRGGLLGSSGVEVVSFPPIIDLKKKRKEETNE